MSGPVAAVMLAGGLRPSALRDQLGFPILCLPVNEQQMLLTLWLMSFVEIGGCDVLRMGAIEILRPAAILSRRYRNVESDLVAELLIIYWNHSRQMEGHFPPVCYPANGWVASGTNTVSVEVADKTIPMRVYEFFRIKGWRTESRLRVLNFFLTSEGTTTSSFSEIRRVPFRHAYTTGGVGQIQVITPGDWELQRSAAVCSELLTGLSQLLTDLAGGGQEL